MDRNKDMGHSPEPFISYAREDINFARRIASDLRRLGANPWLDVEKLIGGEDWESVIQNAIKRSSHVVALLSEHSVNKRGYVQKELKSALNVFDEYPPGEIFLVPIRLSDINPRHEGLERLHWIDLFPKYNDGLAKLAKSLGLSTELIQYISDFTFYTIEDRKGKVATVRSVEKIAARTGNINTLYTRSLTASGQIKGLTSNLGKAKIMDEGGVSSVNVYLTSSLPIEDSIEHILTYKGVDCFIEPFETITQNVTKKLDLSGIHLSLPEGRPCKNIQGKLAIEGSPLEGGILEVSSDNLHVKFYVIKPKVGTRLILSWEW